MKILQTRDPGDSIRIETTIKQTTPFSDIEDKIDPDTIEITIKDPSDTKTVDSVSMTKNATGEYYYIWDTTTSSTEGDYEVIIEADEAGSIEIDNEYIRLKKNK